MLKIAPDRITRARTAESPAGFSLVELMISIGIFLVISGVVTQALLQMTNSNRTIWNRTQMHAGVRSATELLQQEVGQAGRISLPYTTTLNGNVVGGAVAQTVAVEQQVAALPAAAVAGVAGIFVGEQLTVDAGEDAAGNELQETVFVTAVDTAITNPSCPNLTTLRVTIPPSSAVFTMPRAGP